jgi:predicted ATPase
MLKFFSCKDTLNFAFLYLIFRNGFHLKIITNLNIKKIVITGGPSTGKTTLINDLKALDYFCFEEIIRKLTENAKKSGDITERKANPIAFVDDSLSFNKTLINLRIKDYKASKKLETDIVFFDRGIPDVLAYMSYFNQDISKEFTELCQFYRYDFVFILPPWEAIYEDDEERFETFEQATDIYHQLKKTYQDLGYKIIEVPFGNVKQRTRFIIEQLNL